MTSAQAPLAPLGLSPSPLTRRFVGGAIAAIAALGCALGLEWALGMPVHVATITVQNGSDQDLLLTATHPGAEGYVGLGPVGKQSTARIREVLDQGDLWIIGFRSQGVDGGTVTISRADLAAADWTIEVPVDVVTRLREGGARPSP